MVDVIELVKLTLSTNAAGGLVESPSSREVFATVKSVGMKEFYQAAAVGLQPEITFVLSDYYDYDGERVVKYNNVRYAVLRTYRTGNALELVCKTEVNH